MHPAESKFLLNPGNLGESVEKKTLLEEYENIESLCLALHSSLTAGLSNDFSVLKKHRDYFGENLIPTKMPHNYFYYLFKAFKDWLLFLLICGGLIFFIKDMVKDPSSGGIDGLAIIVAVIIIVLVSSINDYTKELKFKNLHKTIKLGNTCNVMRDGKVIEIGTKDLVVGDVYLPKYGDLVPADAVVFQANGIQAEESAMTGESDLIAKDPIHKPYLLAGTHIMEGSGKALIVAVGYYSQTGRIIRMLGEAKKNKTKKKKGRLLEESSDKVEITDKKNQKCRSVLQEKLTKLALLVGKIGVTAGVLVFLILLVTFCVKTYSGPNPETFQWYHLYYILEFALDGFTVVIVAVPEGLPLAVTLALAYSVMKMLKDKNLVRQLYSCETMGNATTICSDKTGTLTTNRMTVLQAFLMGDKKEDLSIPLNLPPLLHECLCMNICINKSSSSFLEEIQIPGSSPRQFGNKTDCALLGFLTSLNADYNEIIKKYPEEKYIKIFPFNSDKKFMCVVVDIGDNKVRVLVKGAPDVLLCKCAKEFSKFAGEIEEISSLSLINIKKSISDMACDSLRTILLAFKDIPRPDSDENLTEQILVCDLILLTVVGIEDPVRPGVPDAIICCNRAGIVVRMVTGDNIVTAKSIAKKAGIIQNEEKELILDSQKFNQLIHDKNGNFNQDLFDKVWPKLKVLARSTPRDKYILVNGIVNTNLPNKQIVAVTGDGTNDAPALKRADVGFAMGIAGTDVAKEACDIIITDDNFLSIVKAIIWGRNVYDSISKFIQFQLTVNFVAILTSILTTAIYGTTLFHPAQFLWINLIMDTLASLALATENPTDDLLNRKPYSRDRSLLSKNMVVFIALHGIFQLTIIIIVIFAGPILFSFDNAFPLGDYLKKNNLSDMDTQHITFIFNIFVFMTLFNEINATKIHAERNVFRGNFKNKIFVSVIIITLILQFCIVQFTYTFFHVKPLNFELWMWSLFFGFSELIYHQIVVLTLIKMIVIPKKYRIQKGISSAIIISEEITQFDARVVWIRGFKKLQQELQVINAFRDNLVVRKQNLRSTDDEIPSYYSSIPDHDSITISKEV